MTMKLVNHYIIEIALITRTDTRNFTWEGPTLNWWVRGLAGTTSNNKRIVLTARENLYLYTIAHYIYYITLFPSKIIIS